MSDILIAVDLSSFSENLINTGLDIANRMNASVTLFSVVELGIGIGLPEGGPVYVDDISSRISEVENRLEAYKEKYPDHNINIVVATGNPKTATLTQAHDSNAAILVVGTHGRTGLDHMLLGSNAEYIIRHSRIPVLVVPYNREEH
ncbi:universal stress protein [Chitinophaga sp. 30R24]|uniref:universal stress protein n=1 Tax=Chitinophaga sp. 30R24 TaxID=3248838 RepID=UPI003B92082B